MRPEVVNLAEKSNLKTNNMRACGLDVHKDSVFVCIITEDGELFQEKFGVLTPELEQMRRYLQDHGTTDVCMESTSVYWIPVWNVLEGHFNLKLVNPYFIRQLPGRKSDIKDAEWIATCLMKDLIRGSYVPESIVRQLRQYNRMIFDLNKEISRKLVKLDACVQRCNIRLSNYVSTVDSKGYQSVVRDISEGVTDPGKLLKRVHRRTVNRWGRDTILASLCGVITETDCDIMRMYLEELDIARAHLAECQRKMTQMCREHFPKHFQRIQTMPGVGERSATAIIAEVGVDMTSFETAAALVSWAGLKPRNDESAGKIKSRRITHGNKYLRKSMVECSWAAANTRNCFFSRFSYTQTVVRHKNRMKVQVAIARKMLVAVWHILSEGVAYRECFEHQEAA